MIKHLEKPKTNKSGVYQFLDANNKVIYVGSSKNLYERIRTYNRVKGNIKHSILNQHTKKIIYIYCDDYREKEIELIKELQPIHNKKDTKEEIYLKRNFKYIDNRLGKLALKKSEVLLVPTKKGTGKTTQWIREALIGYLKNGKPSFYVRATGEQLEEFIKDDKFVAVLDVVGFPYTRDMEITKKGLFILKYDRKTKKKIKKPIINFLNINDAMKIQSSKFLAGNYFIVDEIQNHFMKSQASTFNKFINLAASVLREENTPIVILFNKVNNSDIFLQKFKVDKQVQKIKAGAVKTFERTIGKDQEGKPVKIKVSIYNPRQSRALKQAQKKAVATRMSYMAGDYGNVINSDDFYIDRSKIKYIERLGNFEGIINMEGYQLGLWHKGETFQFTTQYNKTGKEYFIGIGDYSTNTRLVKEDFLLTVKNRFLSKEVEFEDALVYDIVVKSLKSIDLYRNKK